MRTSPAGLDLIKAHEGYRSKAYLCPAGVWTIGYGHTRGVKPGMTCTKEQAHEWLMEDVKGSEHAVLYLVKSPLTQGQFDALVSFVFNLGGGALEQSTLLRRLNEGNYAAAADQFPRWNKARDPDTGILRELNGLTARRADERALFMGGQHAVSNA